MDILSNQLNYLIKEGKTKEEEFEKELQNTLLGVSSQLLINSKPQAEFIKLDNFYQELSKSVTSNRLSVRDSQLPCAFNIIALQKLKGSTWLNDELLVACLNLSGKLPFVRVGRCIPIHQDLRPNIPMERPFQIASQNIKTWRKEAGQSELVYFFPLNQNCNHFTLLEINEREGYIYHYNSIQGNSIDVEVYFN